MTSLRREALMIATALVVACTSPSTASSPTPTASLSPVATATPTATPSAAPSPTPTVVPGFIRYTSAELGFSVDLPPGWRRANCSPGIATTSPIKADEMFVGVPEVDETISLGARLIFVHVSEAQGLTPLAWLQQRAHPPDVRIEPVTVGQRAGARQISPTGDTTVLVFLARGWIYAIERTDFGGADEELARVLPTLQVLTDATVARTPLATQVPRSPEVVVDALADAFARKDLSAIADAIGPCITVGAIPGDAASISRTRYMNLLATELNAGTTVRVQTRPIESDPNFGRIVRSTWSKSGQPDQRQDFVLSAKGDRWSVSAAFVRSPAP
jgi:hypothetical protein